MRLEVGGTHEDAMMAIAPTGNCLEFRNTVFHRTEDGKTAERRAQSDVIGATER
jgi:predicted ester cyclase